MILAQSARCLPYAVLIVWPLLRSLPPELFESAALDGYGPWGQLWRVALPLSRRAIAAAWSVAFVLAFGELPATNLVQPPGVTTITFRIWTLLHTGVESHLAGVALVMLSVVAGAALLAVWGLRSIAARAPALSALSRDCVRAATPVTQTSRCVARQGPPPEADF